jgi:hypothetical protein
MSNEVLEINVADEIKHLSIDQIEELYQKYLNGEKNADLISDYQIDINPNKLIKILPPQNLPDTLCPYCQITMFQKRKSKSASNSETPPAECFSCHHKIFANNKYYQEQCNCKECQCVRSYEKFEAKREKREKILELYDLDDRDPRIYSELTFFDKLVLLTLFRMQTDECFEFILSSDDPTRTESFSPNREMENECLVNLYRSNTLIIDPESRVEAFSEENEFNSFFINKVRWIPNISLDGINRAKLSDIYNAVYSELSKGIQGEWEDDIYKTLFNIAKEEVLQYVYVKTNELNINFSAEKKTREVVNQLLEEFSVSEIYYFVKKAVEDAHLYYAKGFANSKKHAANTIPNKMLSLGERALSEGWNTYRYSRDKRAPRSKISYVFYDFFLGNEDSGFHKSPGKHWNQELEPKYFSKDKAEPESDLSCSYCKSQNVLVKMIDGNLEITCKECGCNEQFTPKN